jgi:copper chaperone CopZ
MTQTIKIQNLKCGGCKASILKGLSSINGIDQLDINVEQNTVSFSSENEEANSKLTNQLIQMGYPPADEDNNLLLKGKSYVHCMIGKASNLNDRIKGE